jgi:hypothetical protein
MENSIERTNDYPVMTLISMFYSLLAYTSIVIGIIVFVVNFNDYLEYGLTGLGISVICFVVTKFISEVARILADIANNVKLIRSNSDYLATK